MPLITGADIDFALKDFSGAASQNVTYGRQSCWGDLKREPVHEAVTTGLERVGTRITLTMRNGALSGLVDDTPITVDGAAFVVRDVGTALQDGTRILTLVEA